MRVLLILAIFISFCTSCFAQGGFHTVEGRVITVDATAQSFSLRAADKAVYVFAVNSLTDYSIERKNKSVADTHFDSLRSGQSVKVGYFPGDTRHTADEVIIVDSEKR